MIFAYFEIRTLGLAGYIGQIRGLLGCQRSQRTCAVKLRLQTDSCQREPILRFGQIRNLR